MDDAWSPPSARLSRESRGGHHLLWPQGAAPPAPEWFDPAALAASGRARTGGTGRAGTVYFDLDGRTRVLRHYRRGGLVRRLSADRYLHTGLTRSRPWRELAVLTRLHAAGLPVPPPVGARVVRAQAGLYRGDLLTQYLPGARTLPELLRADAAASATWRAVGATLARFHAAGLDHADLNAHNVVLDADATVHLIDFDRAVIRPRRGRWCERNLARLRRSLDKLARTEAVFAFTAADWAWLRAGYRSG
jgi:3-deoxy-D-manno-octulosonic acid kinase